MIILLVTVTVVAATVLSYSRRRGRLPLPPGPRPNFFTGNLHQLPKKEPWRMYYDKWAEIYGPIFSFRVPNQQYIVLSSMKAATELLDSHATTYSDRPRTRMVELAKQTLDPFQISFADPYFKMYRTVFKSSLSTRAIQTYQSLQIERSRVLLDRLHKDPEQFVSHMRKDTAAVILSFVYGWRTVDDYWIGVAQMALESGYTLSYRGRWLVEMVPSLRFLPAWFPGAGFKREAFDVGQMLNSLAETSFNWTKEQIKGGIYEHSFISEQLLPEDQSTISAQKEEVIKWCSQGVCAAGIETSAALLTSFILAMALYPEVQKHAQAEIDAVVGQDQFPAFKDREKLPYISALIQELLRWAPIGPEGIPHHAMKEGVYEGYRIPKGSVVIANLFSISRDKETYPEPLEFRPERFLGSSPQLDPRKFVFGFGHRRCPGLHFVEASLYLNISCILAAFTIAKQLDETGEEITPVVEFEDIGIIWFPKPFKCRFIPRNKDLLETLSQ
ncbi:cytochrome P450 [Suillus spraguei]|nr:cytochrome P450 [Suillus spraguei]